MTQLVFLLSVSEQLVGNAGIQSCWVGFKAWFETIPEPFGAEHV